MTENLTKASKFLSLLLRHKPEEIGLTLDAQGWANIDELVARSAASESPLTRSQIFEVVSTSDKKRFAISPDGRHVRANQGHSIDVDLDLESQIPPDILYHGTATRHLDSIFANGVVKGRRHLVHLSSDKDTAFKVGQRHGKPVVLRVSAAAMVEAGHVFYLSKNRVWLTEHVPAEFLSRAPDNPL